MRRGKTGFLALILALFLGFIFRQSSAAVFTFGETAVKLLAGCQVEIKPDHITFHLEEGRLELIPEADNLRVRTVDKNGKVVYTGTQGRVFAECQPEKFQKLKVTDADYRFIRFALGKPEPDPAGRGVLIPKGTRIEKVGEDLYRFHLENGEVISFKCKVVGEDKIGDCTRYTKDGKIMYTRTKVKLCRMSSLEELKSLPSTLPEQLWVQFVTESKG
ncbi:MAG: hypothetical protein QHH43_07925 [Candidatus Saccharicenans sp.]|jgi:hypothetical protein|nr:hypothetical protein [Candidatus Saccharicenans sp.]MDH7575666.1 hypothetical protein [Candidatus Saccharicenans sp.]